MASIRRLNPSTLFDAGRLSFSQVAISQGQTWVHVAGQAAIDRDMGVVAPDDLAAQTPIAFENLRLALDAAGAELRDVVALRIYVVALGPDCIAPIQQALDTFFPADAKPPSTLLGVAVLAMPGLRIEIEATAVC